VAVRAEVIEQGGVVDLDRDRQLVLQYQAGEQAAFDELYRRYYPRLHLYCQRRVGDAHVAEELAQESFLKALRAMPRFAGERRFYPWMTVIAQRLCIDHHRRTARVEPSAEVDLGTVDEDHDDLYAAVDRDHLGAAMARLAPRHREVLDLREQRGWSYSQIAAHLDVPVTTVEALLHRARKALRREFLAVSDGGRLAAIPFVGWIAARIARLQARLAGTPAEHALPLAGSLAAGLAALGLVLGPLAGPSPAQRPQPVATAPVAVPTASGAPPAIVGLAPAAPAAGTGSGSAATASDPAAPATPAPSADLGVAQVYTGPQGTAWAEQEAAAQPVHVDLGPVAQIGLNPVQMIDDLTNALTGGSQ